MGKVLIHVGLPKCASSFIQRRVLPNLDGVTQLGVGVRNESNILVRGIANYEQINWKYEKLAILRFFSAYKNQNIAVSNEQFAGGTYHTGKSTDRETIALRLQNLFPQATVLMVIRNQYDFLRSVFVRELRGGRTSFRHLRNWMNAQIKGIEDARSSILYMPQYTRLFELYSEIWGKDNVIVLQLENLSKTLIPFLERSGYNSLTNPDFTIRTNSRANWLDILNSKYRLGSSNPNGYVRKGISIFADTAKRINVFSVNTRFSEEQINFIGDFYAEENRRLELSAGLDLSGFGYP